EDGIRDFHVTGVQTCALPISTPLSIATPKSAMKPTDADRLRFIPRIHNAAMPPTSAKGTLPTTRIAGLTAPKVRYSRTKIAAMKIGRASCRKECRSRGEREHE